MYVQILTEFLPWGILRFGMRQMIVIYGDEEVRKYWVMRMSEEIVDGMEVKAGDALGWQGWLPQVIGIGAPRVVFPKSVEYNSGETAMIEGYFFGNDGKYYIGRHCSLLLLLDGYCYGAKYILNHETVELDMYIADASIIFGKNLESITSLYGFRENEIPVDNYEDVNVMKWLEEMRIGGKLDWLSPYNILVEFENSMDILSNSLEDRIYLRDDQDNESEFS